MKSKSESKRNKSINIVDRSCQKANAIVEELKISRHLKSSMWEQISDKLNHINKKVLSWLFLTAASFSLLVAANFDFSELRLIQEIIDSDYNATIVSEKGNNMKPTIRHSIELDNINNSKIEPAFNTSPISLTKTSIKPFNLNKEISPSLKNIQRESPKRFSPQITSSFSPKSYTQEFGLNFLVWNSVKDQNHFKLKIGSAIGFNRTISKINYSEQAYRPHRKINPLLFITSTFEKTNIIKDSTWSTNLSFGYNLENWRDSQMRIGFQKSLGKHVKLGPEIMINNKKVLPGISLCINS